MDSHHEDSSVEYVYSAYKTLRNERRIYAKEYGKKAFCFRVSRDKRNDENSEE